jgi:hypothetical protein
VPVEVVLVLGALVAVAGYLAACRWWPYARCLRCGGSGQRRSSGTPFYAFGGGVALVGGLASAGPVFVVGAAVVLVGLFIRGGSFRRCPRCVGTGRRQRLGRRLVGSR